MPRVARAVVEPLGGDIVAAVQCIAIDADAFPYASAPFGRRSPSWRIWTARIEGEPRVIAFLAARLRARVLHIDGLAVDRAFRRRGVGLALVSEAATYARSHRLRAVELHVSLANGSAIALYDAAGFIAVRRLRSFYPAGAFDGERDAYRMLLRP